MQKTLILSAFTIIISLLASSQNQVAALGKYMCPPCNSTCDEIHYDTPGVCLHCNMVLVKKNDSKTIAFYLQDGVEVLDFAGPMEVFVYAGYNVFTVSADKSPIRSQGILKVTTDYTLKNAPEADILAFFGGNSRAAFGNKKVIDWVKSQPDVDYHFSVCTGAFVLGEAGLLDEKTATTFHDSLDDLEEMYPKIDVRRDVRFVDNGSVVTTAGVSAGIDGALHMVAKLQGLNAAKRVAYYMEYDNWKPGDGLLLTEENPYQPTISLKELAGFSGKYAFQNDEEVHLVLNEEKKQLYAQVGKNEYPIYHEKGDVFSTHESEPIYFVRDKRDSIIGYRIDPEGTLYQKLD